MIIPVIVMRWLMKEMSLKKIMKKMTDREIKNIHDLFEWMMKRYYKRILSYWETQEFIIWIKIMMLNKKKFENELKEEFESDSDYSNEKSEEKFD